MSTFRQLSWPLSGRKLFLLVFLWTCLCLFIFKSSLFSVTSEQQAHHHHHQQQHDSASEKLHARSAAPLYLASPEFALPDNSNNNALYYYSLSSISSSSQKPSLSSPAASQPSNSQEQASQQSQPSSSSKSDSDIEQQQSQPPSSSKINTILPSPHAKSNVMNTNEPLHHHHQQQQQRHQQQVIAGSKCKYNYPHLFDLQFNNIHWQKMTTKPNTTNGNNNNNSTGDSTGLPATYYLYNAYYDDRWRGGIPSIRILAMIDRVQPPPTNCLLWSSKVRASNVDDDYFPTGSTQSMQSSSTSNNNQHDPLVPLVTRASFVYAWYPKWGNYKDGILQPWIVTCPMLKSHIGLIPESVSLVQVPPEKELPPEAPMEMSIPPPVDEIVELVESGGEQQHDQSVLGEARFRRSYSVAAAAAQAGLPISDSLQPASIAMPPSFSSSSPSIPSSSSSSSSSIVNHQQQQHQHLSNPSASTSVLASPPVTSNSQHPRQQQHKRPIEYDCDATLPITNNLPVYNQVKPAIKEKFAVCVKGLDFPHEDVSVRLVEWIELLNLLGAGKIFLYELDVHENISKVLNYYQKRGLVELSPLTLPGAQPNLPEYQHLYLKSKLTAKRQNELIPYNDCLYRNLNSYQYLALLDIDEIIMPLEHHHNWYDLMAEVESMSLSEQNYSRASYNVRNVYFFDDLAGPLGTLSPSSSSTTARQHDAQNNENEEHDDGEQTEEGSNRPNRGDSLERGIPHYLHMMQHVYRSKNYTKPGQYVKCFHNTERVVSLHNHFPMNCFGQCTTYSIPVHLAHLQHYRKDCVGPLKQSCKNDFRVFTTRDTTIWKYKQQMIKRTTRVLNHLGLLNSSPQPTT